MRMKTVVRLALVMTVGALAIPVPAQELTGDCTVGTSVTNRQGKTGVVTASSGSYCNVTYPDGTKGYHPSFMLRLAGTATVDPKDVASVATGTYNCYAGSPLQYQFIDVNVKSATAYTDVKNKAGVYSYDPRTQLLTFTSGTFEGQFAKYLGKGKIGLAAKETTFFATVCSLKK